MNKLRAVLFVIGLSVLALVAAEVHPAGCQPQHTRYGDEFSKMLTDCRIIDEKDRHTGMNPWVFELVMECESDNRKRRDVIVFCQVEEEPVCQLNCELGS